MSKRVRWRVGTIKRSASHPAIEHQHGLRALTLTAEIDGNPLTVIKTLDNAIADLHLPKDIYVAYTGEYSQLIDTRLQMIWVFLGSALLVYGIIALQLGSMFDPLVVLVKLPLDFMGVAFALYITHQALDLTVVANTSDYFISFNSSRIGVWRRSATLATLGYYVIWWAYRWYVADIEFATSDLCSD